MEHFSLAVNFKKNMFLCSTGQSNTNGNKTHHVRWLEQNFLPLLSAYLCVFSCGKLQVAFLERAL